MPNMVDFLPMPRPAQWLQQIPEALELLEQIETTVIDRATLERLLRIHRRAAIRLMHRFGGYQAGRTFLIDRAALLRQLGAIAAGESYRFEAGRRERLVRRLDQARQELAARRILIPVTPGITRRELATLPPTIHLTAGKLEIACTGAKDLLGQLMDLAQAIANQFEEFELRVRPACAR
jgi:hypothetical protein